MVQRYKKDVFVEAIEFVNTPENHQAIIDFTGHRISVEYDGDIVQVRVIRGAYTVLVAKLGQWIVKESNGTLQIYTKEALETEYQLVTE